MSYATRFCYITTVSVAAAICVAAKAVSDEVNSAPNSVAPVRGTTNGVVVPPSMATAPNISGAAKLLPNGGVVTPFLLRSAQPTTAQFAALKKAGLKTVVNLRDGAEDVANEKAVVEKLGLKFVNISMSSFKPVKGAYINSFLNIVDDPANRPVLVHCRQGEDRTGSMCAIYRMTRQGWTGPQAYREMINFGFHPQLLPLLQSVIQVSNTTAVPIAGPTISDMTDDMKQRVQRFYTRKMGGTNLGGFSTNF